MKTLVAIPVYNNFDVLEKTLQSCTSQSLDLKILVSDNNSKNVDATILRKIKSDKNIIYFKHNTNLGRVGNWNYCLRFFYNSNFCFLKFIFPGDELALNCIEICENIFMRNKNVGIVVGKQIFVTKNNKRIIDKVIVNNKSLSFKNLTEMGYYPSKFLGSLDKICFSKNCIKNKFFDNNFLGGHSFSNSLYSNFDVFYTNNILSIFHVKNHNSFDKQFKFQYKLEYFYNYIVGLSFTNKNSRRFKIQYLKTLINIIILTLVELFNNILKNIKF